MIRYIYAFTLVFLASLSISVLHVSAHAADKIRIGVPAIVVQFASLPLGAKRGFFQEAGLQAEFIQMSPTVAMAALLSGGIDYWTSFGGPVAGAIRGASYPTGGSSSHYPENQGKAR